MQYIISIFLVIASIIKKKSKLIIGLLSVSMWILFAFNDTNPDYIAYERIYSGEYAGKEYGFNLICSIFRNLGFTYSQFIIVISFFIILFSIKEIKIYTDNHGFVLGFYCLFPFLLDVIQIRNLIAAFIVFIALKYIFINDYYSMYRYVLMILFASTIHFSFIFYLLLLFAKYIALRSCALISITFSLLGCIVAMTDILPTLLSYITDYSKIISWFDEDSGFSFFVNIIIQSIFTYFVYLAYDYVKENKSVALKFNQRFLFNILKRKKHIIPLERYGEIILKINFICIMLFPLYWYNSVFFRLYRNMFIINYCFISFVIFSMKRDYKNLYILLFTVFIICLFCYFIDIDYIVKEIFENNVIFRWRVR